MSVPREILKLLFGMGRQVFMWSPKPWLYVQNRRQRCVSAVTCQGVLAGQGEQDGASVSVGFTRPRGNAELAGGREMLQCPAQRLL